MPYIGLVFALILSIIDYYTEGHFINPSKFKSKFISFSAGVSVTFIFLLLLPEIYKGVSLLNNFEFISILVGFTLFHLIEKHLKKHGGKINRKIEHQRTHMFVDFLYFIIVGIVLVELFNLNFSKGFLFFIPAAFHTIIQTLPYDIVKNKFIKFLSASSVLIGAFIATFFSIPSAFFFLMIGFVGGALLYIVVRESIPHGSSGYPRFFFYGTLIYTLIILLTWYI